MKKWLLIIVCLILLANAVSAQESGCCCAQNGGAEKDSYMLANECTAPEYSFVGGAVLNPYLTMVLEGTLSDTEVCPSVCADEAVQINYTGEQCGVGTRRQPEDAYASHVRGELSITLIWTNPCEDELIGIDVSRCEGALCTLEPYISLPPT
ncbi:MAG: hypothetical protein ACE5FT_02660, partial [Candidatus Nanoarchaeia archaeon]